MEDQKRIEKEFGSLPLDEKLSTLFRMEVSTLSEAFRFVMNDPMKLANKVGDFIVEFGHRVENEFRKASENRSTAEPPTPKKKTKKQPSTGDETSDIGSV